MIKHSIKSRAARLVLGLIVLGSSSTALIGAGAGVAHAAPPAPIIDKVIDSPPAGLTLGFGQVMIYGRATVGEVIELRVRDATVALPDTYAMTVWTDSSGNFFKATTAVPKSACGHPMTVQAHSLSTNKWSTTKKFTLFCGPQLGHAKDGFIGRYFTPGGKVDVTRISPDGKVVKTEHLIASASGTISGKTQCLWGVIAFDFGSFSASTAWWEGICLL